MCLYTYNRTDTTNNVDSYEFNVLSNIYEAIRNDNKEQAISLTKELIATQDNEESIAILNEAINSLR